MNRPTSAEESQSILGIFAMIARSWRLIVMLPLAFAVIVVVGGVLLGRPSRAESVFQPQSVGEVPSNLASLAAQFGVSGIGGDAEPLGFYSLLVTSRELLSEAVSSRYEIDGDSMTLVDAYGIEANLEPDLRHAQALARLEETVQASANGDAGVVHVRVEAESPGLAVQINRRLLELVNEFNLLKRTSQAREEREFVENRLAEARRELEQAEELLEAFLEANRTYQTSPTLTFDANRLNREVELRQSVVASLAQGYELARIEEIRATPVITVVDAPERNVFQPGWLVPAVMAGTVGFVLAIVLAAARAYWSHLMTHYPAEYQRLRSALPRLTPTPRG